MSIVVRIEEKTLRSFKRKVDYAKEWFGRFGSLKPIEAGLDGRTIYQVFCLTLS